MITERIDGEREKAYLKWRIANVRKQTPAIREWIAAVTPHVQESLLFIAHHGYVSGLPGNCAVAYVIETDSGNKRLSSALHNIDRNGSARIVDPVDYAETTYPFVQAHNPATPDTAVSADFYTGIRPALPIGRITEGDIVSFEGIRHGGKDNIVRPSPCWGVVVGKATDPNDRNKYWQAAMIEGTPQYGDSGSAAIRIPNILSSFALARPSVVGVLRGNKYSEDWGNTVLFSPNFITNL